MIKYMRIHPESDAEWIEEFESQEDLEKFQENLDPYCHIFELCKYYDEHICHALWLRYHKRCDQGKFGPERCARLNNLEQ